jgi:hypothetical protein
VLRALGQNPTEGEVRKLVQSSCKVKVPEVRYHAEFKVKLLVYSSYKVKTSEETPHERLRRLR